MGICMSNHSVMAIDIESQSKGDPSSQRIATSATATKVNGHQVQPQQQIPNHHRSNNNAHDTTQGIVNADNSTHNRTAQQQQQSRSNHESTTTHPQSALMPSLGKRVLSTEALDRNENLLGTISLHSTSPSPTTTNATSNGVTTDTVFHQQQQLSPSNLQHQQQQQQGAPIQFPSSVSSSSAQPPYITTITPPSPQTQPSPSTMIITVNNVNSVPLPQIHRTSPPTNNGSNTSGGGGGGGSSSGANSNYSGSNNIIINNNGLSTGDSRRAKPSPLHMMAVTNNLRNKEEIEFVTGSLKSEGTDKLGVRARKSSFHSVMTQRGSVMGKETTNNSNNGNSNSNSNNNNNIVESVGSPSSSNTKLAVDNSSVRRRSGSDFKIEFSEQGDKFRSIQQWLNESILDHRSINPILPIPGSECVHRLPSSSSLHEGEELAGGLSTSNRNLSRSVPKMAS